MKRIAKWLAKRAGFEIRRLPVASIEKEESANQVECRSAIKAVRANTMVPDSGLESLYDQACFCESTGIDGAFVECGVWKGGAVGMMALANLRHGKTRRDLHLFDIFDAICEPDANVDGERALREVREFAPQGGTGGKLRPLDGFYDSMGGPGNVNEVERLLSHRIGYPMGFLHMHVGWFQDTLPLIAPQIGKIALLRLDGDWYASTKVCLDHLASKVVPGGFVVVDDYGAYAGCRKATDEYLDRLPTRPYLHRVNEEIHYWIAPRND